MEFDAREYLLSSARVSLVLPAGEDLPASRRPCLFFVGGGFPCNTCRPRGKGFTLGLPWPMSHALSCSCSFWCFIFKPCFLVIGHRLSPPVPPQSCFEFALHSLPRLVWIGSRSFGDPATFSTFLDVTVLAAWPFYPFSTLPRQKASHIGQNPTQTPDIKYYPRHTHFDEAFAPRSWKNYVLWIRYLASASTTEETSIQLAWERKCSTW